ncbi:hypothetical protein OKW43_005701 [Paraburkholderia sp. WC7.3g]
MPGVIDTDTVFPIPYADSNAHRRRSVGKLTRRSAPVRASPALVTSGSRKFHWRNICLRGKESGVLFHDLVTHRDDGLRRKRHRNKGADASGRWRREKKHPSSRVPRIGRFNWRPRRYRPVIKFSSFAAPASVDVRRAPLRSPALRTLYGLAAETNTPAAPVSKMQPTRELADGALHQLVTVGEHAGRRAYIFWRRI